MKAPRAYPGYRTALIEELEGRTDVIPHADGGADIPLDDHQQEAMQALLGALHERSRKEFALVLACGAGKTYIAGNVVGASQAAKEGLGVRQERRDIFLTTERTLVDNAVEKLTAIGLGDDVGVWGDRQHRLDRPILVATIQALLANRKELGKHIPLNRIDLVIGDEADMYLTDLRSETVRSLNAALRIGLTGTERWRDGRNISSLWGEPVHRLTLRQGIQLGINTPPVWYLYHAAIDAEQLRISGGDYEPKALAAAMKHAEIHRAIPEIYEAVVPAGEREKFPTLVYVPNTTLVRMVTKTLQEQFGSQGVTVRGWVGEEMSPSQLRQDVQDFRTGQLNILVLCEMGGRGLDVPIARCIIDGYPTLSPTKVEQRHARGMRTIREGNPDHPRGFLKDYTIVVQIHPQSGTFRPVCLPDILNGWEEAKAGKPLGFSPKNPGAGAPWLEEVEELHQRIERKKPTISVSLDQRVDLYKEVVRYDELPRAGQEGFFEHDGQRHGTIGAWMKALNLNFSTIKSRLQGVHGITGRDARGRVLEHAFYPESTVRTRCADVLDEEMPKADRSGFFTLDGVRHGTVEAWCRTLQISRGAMLPRLERHGARGITARNWRGSVNEGGYYAENVIREACSDLL